MEYSENISVRAVPLHSHTHSHTFHTLYMLHPQALEHVLSAIPADVWGKHWAECSTVPLRCASKAM